MDHIEIICINDGSTDDSLSVLRRYQQENPNLIVINQQNRGPSAARNAGIAVATGKYIGFVDSDDFIEFDMYHRMYSVAERYNLNLVICSYINDYNELPCQPAQFNLPPSVLLDRSKISALILPELMKDGIFNGPCNKLYSRSFLNTLSIKMPENLHYGEDLIFQLEIFDKLEQTFFIGDPLYHYVHRPGTLSAVKGNLLDSTLVPMYQVRKQYAELWSLPLAVPTEHFVYYALMDLVNTICSAKYEKRLSILQKYLQTPEFSFALKNTNLLTKQYTLKIKSLFLICRLLTK